MNTGVNNNGVRWIKQENLYQCYYYFGEGMELYSIYENVTMEFIEELTFYNLLNEHLHVKKNNSDNKNSKKK